MAHPRTVTAHARKTTTGGWTSRTGTFHAPGSLYERWEMQWIEEKCGLDEDGTTCSGYWNRCAMLVSSCNRRHGAIGLCVRINCACYFSLLIFLGLLITTWYHWLAAALPLLASFFMCPPKLCKVDNCLMTINQQRHKPEANHKQDLVIHMLQGLVNYENTQTNQISCSFLAMLLNFQQKTRLYRNLTPTLMLFFIHQFWLRAEILNAQ